MAIIFGGKYFDQIEASATKIGITYQPGNMLQISDSEKLNKFTAERKIIVNTLFAQHPEGKFQQYLELKKLLLECFEQEPELRICSATLFIRLCEIYKSEDKQYHWITADFFKEVQQMQFKAPTVLQYPEKIENAFVRSQIDPKQFDISALA